MIPVRAVALPPASNKEKQIQPAPEMIHVYPGMGATASMYGPRWKEEIPGMFHDWPEWCGETSISALAERMVHEHQIEDGDIVVGSSLGGIVAGEIAKLKQLQLVVLLGSAARKEEIQRILKLLHPLVDVSPLTFIRACAGKLPGDLMEMFSQSDPRFMRAMTKAVFRWDGIHPSTRLIRIHGRYDRVIPPPATIDRLIAGGHLIAMTHPEECIRQLKELIPDPQR